MEEFVGKLWDRWVTRAARSHYPHAAVTLGEISKAVGLWFRAFGGDPGLQIEATTATRHGARRQWLQRVAGTHRYVELTWRDERALRLPACIDLFPERQLNRNLYLWLAALAAGEAPQKLPWFQCNQVLTQQVLQRFPGLKTHYVHLVEAQLALRPDPEHLPPEQANQECAIRRALRSPGSVQTLPPAKRAHQPVWLWLHPTPPVPIQSDAVDDPITEEGTEGKSKQPKDARRRQAERVDKPEEKAGLLLSRAESLFSWAEFVRVNRGTDEDEDDAAERASEDLDVISVARDRKASASRLRFDLDLPAPAYDDLQLGEGILLPEWDYRKACLKPDYCCVQLLASADSPPCELPAHLRVAARRLRKQFEALIPSPIWLRDQADGSEVDLDAYLRYRSERASGKSSVDCRLYRDFRNGTRDLACLLLADLSMSTDAWVGNGGRIIDVIRDGLFLFAEALAATGDRYAMYGFSSRHRTHVRIHLLKGFNQPYNAGVRGRLKAIKPGFYTRMGAAIRYATTLLAKECSSQRLLLLLTDGKPNDVDQYEGRYGVEDTRMAIMEARRQGLYPFCVTIDEKANDYLPHLFGTGGYVLVRKPSELPQELPLLYARLTQG